MPYANVPDDKIPEMDRCVQKVMGEQGIEKDRAVAICYTSIVEGKSLSDIEKAIKQGRRHSAADESDMQMVHDIACKQGAKCDMANAKMPEPKSLDEDLLISFGTEVKALGGGKVGGYLVRFTDANSPDLSADYFDATTDFGFKPGETIKSPVWFNHRLPLPTKSGKEIIIREQIGEAELSFRDDGIFSEAVLYNRERYEKLLSKLGWSSGTAPNLVDRKPSGKAMHITRWPLGLDASLTPIPAEPRNAAVSLKSYINTLKSGSAGQPDSDESEPEAVVIPDILRQQAKLLALYSESIGV